MVGRRAAEIHGCIPPPVLLPPETPSEYLETPQGRGPERREQDASALEHESIVLRKRMLLLFDIAKEKARPEYGRL